MFAIMILTRKMMNAVPIISLALMVLLWTNSGEAQPGAFSFQSVEQQTALLELYTSEGCSSCPPAEAWLTRLKDDPALWRNFVPVAFHVDYWDHLGWRDPWAAKAFSERQRNHAESWSAASVYTPGFVLNGKEWRGWPGLRTLPPLRKEKAGVLTVNSTNSQHW